jgi:hypothetical protein
VFRLFLRFTPFPSVKEGVSVDIRASGFFKGGGQVFRLFLRFTPFPSVKSLHLKLEKRVSPCIASFLRACSV